MGYRTRTFTLDKTSQAAVEFLAAKHKIPLGIVFRTAIKTFVEVLKHMDEAGDVVIGSGEKAVKVSLTQSKPPEPVVVA